MCISEVHISYGASLATNRQEETVGPMCRTTKISGAARSCSFSAYQAKLLQKCASQDQLLKMSDATNIATLRSALAL